MLRFIKGRPIRTALAGAALSAVLTAGGVALADSPPDPDSRDLHAGFFTAYVDHGPDRGLSLFGVLSGKIDDSGDIHGALKGPQPTVPVTGSVKGRKATLVFHLPGRKVVVGSGKASAAIHDFAGLPDRGRFTGPRRADSGTWDQVVCTPQIRPGLMPDANTTYKCVTSEGKVFYTKIPQLAGGGGSGGR